MSKITLLAALGAGYVLGARAGRERYEEIRSGAQKFARNPRVQSATDSAKDKAGEAAGVAKVKAAEAADVAKEKAGEAVSAAQDKVGKHTSDSSGSSGSSHSDPTTTLNTPPGSSPTTA